MQLGFFGINSGPLVDGRAAARIARLAEEAGYDSLWAGEHMVVPSPRVPPSPMEPTDLIGDPLIALSWVAAVTERIALGTGILLLPQRNPVQLAKEIATLDRLSGGRVLVGIGIGYLEPEMRAVGVPMGRRDERAVEYLGAMQALWTMDAPAFDGEFVSFDGVDAHPRPTDRARGPRIVMAGRSAAAWRRTVQLADEWYGFRVDPAQAAEQVAGINRAAERYGVHRAQGEITISVSPSRLLTPSMMDDYAAAGVHRVVVLTGASEVDEIARFVESQAVFA